MSIEQLKELRDRALVAKRVWQKDPTNEKLKQHYYIRVAAFAQACINHVDKLIKFHTTGE